jgi:hypothetical protein
MKQLSTKILPWRSDGTDTCLLHSSVALLMHSTDGAAVHARAAVWAFWFQTKIPRWRIHIEWVSDDGLAIEAGEFAPFCHADVAFARAFVFAVIDDRLGSSSKMRLMLTGRDAVENRSCGLLAESGAVVVVIALKGFEPIFAAGFLLDHDHVVPLESEAVVAAGGVLD